MIIVIICYLIILINFNTKFVGVFIRYRSVVVINFAKTSLAIAVTVLMTACASNKGGFDLNQVEPPPRAQDNKPKLQDAPSEPRTQEQLDAMMEPSLGVEVSLLEPNSHPRLGDEQKSFETSNIVAIYDDFDKLTERQIRELNASPRRSEAKIAGTHDDGGDGFFASRNRSYLKFVKSGWIADLETKAKFNFSQGQVYRGINGSVFYLGKNPATALPTGQVISYKGDWDFATNAVKSRDPSSEFTSEVRTYPGQRHSALSYHESVVNDAKLREAGIHKDGSQPHSHTSEFTVDFDKKKLTGTLKYNKYDKATKSSTSIDRYNIDAKLYGNRFRGNAKSTNTSDAYFGASSSTLEGGFFGANAEELAGKFLTDDNSLFGVFGARQFKDGKHVDGDNVAKADRAFDAVAINTNSFEKRDLDTFGDATKLVINGRSFSLLPANAAGQFIAHNTHDLKNGSSLVTNACCSNLSYVKFGNYFTSTGDSKSDGHLFLTGERTPLAQMLTTGQYEYVGTWEANVLTQGQKVGGVSPSQGVAGSRAKFGVDFAAKTLTGSLYQENGAKPAIIIKDGVIRGNGFSAKFESGASGFVLDRTTGDAAHVFGNVSGAFYGPEAIELGGYFKSDEASKDKIGGVFGAKKQVLTQ